MTSIRLMIGPPEALDLLGQAVAVRGPDFVYRDRYGEEEICCYVDRAGRAACMLAVALTCAGVSEEELAALTGSILFAAGYQLVDAHGVPLNDELRGGPAEFAEAILMDRTESELEGVGVEITEQAVRIWWAAQRFQDCGFTWAEAEAAGREVATLTQSEVTE